MQLSIFPFGNDELIREERLNAHVLCRLDDDGLHIYCVSQCRNPSWRCAFPYKKRVLGEQYQVARLIAAHRHYKAIGPIVALGLASAEQIALSAQLRAQQLAKKEKPSGQRALNSPKPRTENETPWNTPTLPRGPTNTRGPDGTRQLRLVHC